MPILHGVRPVLVDVDKHWCIDPEKIEEKITKNTKAIMPVHMYGNPANMQKVMEIAKKHKLFVIEDACAAHGAESGGRKVGSIGDIGCFSFYASKNITSGEGGMVVANDKRLADRARLLRSHAFEQPRFIHKELGYNYRMTDLQAAVAYAQSEKIAEKVERRREIAQNYKKLLKDVKEITFLEDPPWGKSTYWMFCILINESFGRDRDMVINILASKNIGSERFYTSMSKQPVFLSGNDPRYPDTRGNYPISHDVARRGMYLPSGLGITLSDQKRVVKELLALRIKGASLLTPTFVREDDRGTFIEALNSQDWKNISFGTMKRGAVMGNHYHKKTDVFFFLTKGAANVDLKHAKSKTTEKLTLNHNEGVIFKPFHSHAITFIKDSSFVMGKSRTYIASAPDTYKLVVTKGK
jgi:perosamine synthetase